MGYARLHFHNNLSGGTAPTIGLVIRDIVGVISGSYTTVNQLGAATQNLSEIYNSAGRGDWTRVYPSTLVNGMPCVLSTPCVNGSTKYIQIGGYGGADTFGTETASDTFGHNLSSAQGIAMRSVTAATSATSVSNPSFLNQISGGTATLLNYITGPYVWLSWSSRHCLIIGSAFGTGTTNICATGCFEFNETSIYDYRNEAPFCHAQWFSISIMDTVNVTPSTDSSNNRSSFQIQNHYRPDTAVSAGSFNLRSAITNVNYAPVMSTAAGFYPSVYTKNSSGAATLYLQPLFWHQHQIGLPHNYISDLCKVYRTQPTSGNPGDLMTVDGNTYAYFDLNLIAGNNFALTLLRA